MKDKFWKTENILFLAAFILAAGLRFIGLGHETLSDYEAGLALQALDFSRGSLVEIGPQPFYVLWTGALFFVFNATNMLARLLPAILGSAMVFSPLLYKKLLGRKLAVILSFGFAVSPVLVSSSRQADGFIVAISFFLFGVGFLLNQKPGAAGIFLGLALLSGPDIWMILLVMAVVLLWGRLLPLRIESYSGVVDDNPDFELPDLKGFSWGKMVPWIIGTLLIAGSIFFIQPSGLSSAGSSFVSFLKGWAVPQAANVLQLIAGLVIVESLAVFIGTFAVLRGWWLKKPAARYFGRIAVTALVIVILYPGHKPVDIGLITITMWCLAAAQIESWSKRIPEEKLPAFAFSAVILVLLIFSWINLAGIPDNMETGLDTQLRWISFSGAIFISLLMSLLVAWGWSSEVGGFGIRAGIIGMLTIFLIFNTCHSTGLGRFPGANPLRNSGYHKDADLIYQTIDDYTEWNMKSLEQLDLSVIGVNSPALKWLLRDLRHVNFTTGLTAEVNPSMLITSIQSSPTNSLSYSGQDFVWNQKPSWSLMQPREWLKWTLYRDVPSEQEMLILWVRGDLMPGAATGPVVNNNDPVK